MFTGTSRFTGITSHVGIPVAAIALLSGIAILRGGAAAADPNDDKFLALLDDEGIPAMEGVPSLVDTAHKVCQALDTGTPANRVVDALVDYAVSNDPTQRQIAPGRLARTEGRFVVAAVGAYCPYDKNKLAILITRPKAGWNEPTRRAADGIRPSGFQVHGSAPVSLIGIVPPAGIADPNPPAIPEPPPLAHLQTPPLPIAAPPRPQQPLPQQLPAPPQQLPAPPQQLPPPPQEPPPPPPQQLPPPPQEPPPPPQQLPPPPQEPPPSPQQPPPPPPSPPMTPGYVKLAP
ncbi:DUF732 domain-containing protein [Mycobacterium sp. Aquia_216]|uniref:DUF732 domain-containing protein n=1 Tax=Mycobacterium sp. Aquia_216 TaxID=2991729 RepID=UPI00227C0D77|nr:DUF732 domain-containing protein [Mycobacterium sp. Aquia_216]WAJ43146.1 DUF732 domain-containing protein [Mycobacterium sp. Aquia_216]